MPAEGALRDRRGADFHLIETLRWEPGVGAVRGDRHLARLARSAEALGFPFQRAEAEARLAAVGANTALRLRITLDRSGMIALEMVPFSPLAPDTVWKIAIAGTRLDSSDPLLVHKTSRRAAYEAARAEFPRETIDEVLLLNERGEVCEGTITSVFILAADGELVTPPLRSGLLAGILREEMVERGEASDGFLYPPDMVGAPELFVGNSLRGLIRAELVRKEGE